MKNLGIDATNIRKGGGLTHLVEILSNINPRDFDFNCVYIWASKETLAKIPNRTWLIKRSHHWLDKTFLFSFSFQILYLSREARSSNCDLLFIPGGTFFGFFPNYVTLSQNMLPFEYAERSRYKDLQSRIRFIFLELSQTWTFKRSKGVIFLTNYAKNSICNLIQLKRPSIVIGHGSSPSFFNIPKEQLEISNFSKERPFNLLYVSSILAYKHQWNVAEAVLDLRMKGYPITLDLVGGCSTSALKRLIDVIKKDTDQSIRYLGEVSRDEISSIYMKADAFVFASSCENQPIILIEAMASGLPIACSNKGPMPEVLGDSSFYFNPLDKSDISRAIEKMLLSRDLRELFAKKLYHESQNYTWGICARRTFEFLNNVKLN